VLFRSRKQGSHPLWGVYLNPEEAILRHMGRLDPNGKEAWENHSHTAWPLVLIAVRRLERQFLRQLWYPITSMQFTETIPDIAWQQVLWRIGKGTSYDHMVLRPTKWSELQEEASQKHRLPHVFAGRLHLLPYFLLVYPHRFTPKLVLSLDDALAK